MKNSEVLVHIDETLDSELGSSLSQNVCKHEGVNSAHLIDNLPHLMVVAYNPHKTKHPRVIDSVKNNGVHAQLIGWL